MPQIISQDTTWTSGQTIEITDEVQIASNATLTIEDGVTVIGGDIRVAGNLVASGTSLSPVFFDETGFISLDGAMISINYSWLDGASTIFDLNGISSLSIDNSVLSNSDRVFYDTGGYETYNINSSAFLNNDVVFYLARFVGESQIAGNYFSNNSEIFRGGYFFDTTALSGNNFLNFDYLVDAPKIGFGYGEIVFSNNYFESPDFSELNSYYSDGNTDVGLSTLSFDPALSSRPLPDLQFIDITNFPARGLEVDGSYQSETLVGDTGNDTISALSGNDTLTGGLGNDLLDGGSGQDTAIYSGNQNSYSLTLSPSSVSIADRRGDGNGTDTLVDIEFLDFDTDLLGSPFDLTNFGGLAGLSSSDFESFIELYIAYFNRSPDAVGLNFWGTAFANGTTLEQMATLFVDQVETRATYPDGTSNTDFVTAVYDNVLGRIPDQAGFNFWIDMLNRSEETGVTRDQFILDVLRGVQDGSSDRAFLDNKVDIGAYFAVHRGMSDVDNASTAMALFDGSQSSINQAVAAIDGYYQDALDPTNGEFLMQVVGVLDNPFAA